ncbi:MAG: transcription elongation factor GreA [Chloroflexi bacterium]|nr:transcription elongation factor GreA [Chloroflexota bacterium]
MEDSLTITDAIAEYVAGLPVDQRAGQQQELGRFARWFGPNLGVDQITGITLETYQEQLVRSGADLARHLEPLKSFVNYAQKKGYIADSIAKLIKLKRVASKREKNGSSSRHEKKDVEEVQLTKEGFQQAKAELDHLINDVRPQVAEELLEARMDRDIRENAPYDAAKQHQAHVESRIRYLERVLANATIIDGNNHPSGRVSIGSTVVLHDLAYDETLTYTLVGSSEADPRAGKISIVSPVGKALIDRAPGDIIEVAAPAGLIQYRVDKIEG